MSEPTYHAEAYSSWLEVDKVDQWADSLRWVRKTPRRRELFQHDPLVFDSPIVYSYAPRNTYTSEPMALRGLIESIMRDLNRKLGSNLNVCFLNRYDNERSGLAWHADDEESLDDSQPIVVVSFGAAREIHTRVKGHKGAALFENRYKLAHGSRFVMPPGYQDTHDHQIPGHTEPIGTRVSLTYRSMMR